MAAGKNNFRTSRPVFNRHNVGANAVTYVILLRRNTLPLMHDSLKLTEVDKYVTTLKAPHRAADNIPGSIFKLVIDHLFLSLPQTLHHGLLGGLCGDPSEVCGSNVYLEVIVHVNFGVQAAGSKNVDLIIWIFDTVANHQGRKSAYIAFFGIDLNSHVPSRANTFTRSRQQCRLKRFDHCLTLDSFFFFVIFEKC